MTGETEKPEFIVRPLDRGDREWVAHFLDKYWSTTQIVSQGKSVYGHLLPGFIAEHEDEENNIEKVGLLTYNLEGDSCEIMTLNSLKEEEGIGTALVEAIVEAAKAAKIKRLWLITTNDNLPALRFWQKRGFHLVSVHQDAIEEARRLKPQIPITGQDGIPVRDEIELEYPL